MLSHAISVQTSLAKGIHLDRGDDAESRGSEYVRNVVYAFQAAGARSDHSAEEASFRERLTFQVFQTSSHREEPSSKHNQHTYAQARGREEDAAGMYAYIKM
jgi:hypothetical protein